MSSEQVQEQVGVRGAQRGREVSGCEQEVLRHDQEVAVCGGVVSACVLGVGLQNEG